MNKPESRKYVVIDATQVEDGDRVVFDSKNTPNPNIFGEGIHNLKLIDIDKHHEDILKECADRLDIYEGLHICELINSFHRVFAVRNNEGNYFPVVVRDKTGDTLVLVTEAKFYRDLPDEETGMPLTCDEFQQQMEQEKAKGMELSSDEFMKLLKERKPSDDFDDTMIDAAMEQLPHKPGLYMAQDDSIWLFDGDYFSLVREKDKSFPSPSRVYRIRRFARESVESGRFPFHDYILPDEPGYYRSADKTRLYYLDSGGVWKLVAAALTPIEQYVEDTCVCNYASAWVSENIVRKDTPLERCDHDLVSDEALRNF